MALKSRPNQAATDTDGEESDRGLTAVVVSLVLAILAAATFSTGWYITMAGAAEGIDTNHLVIALTGTSVWILIGAILASGSIGLGLFTPAASLWPGVLALVQALIYLAAPGPFPAPPGATPEVLAAMDISAGWGGGLVFGAITCGWAAGLTWPRRLPERYGWFAGVLAILATPAALDLITTAITVIGADHNTTIRSDWPEAMILAALGVVILAAEAAAATIWARPMMVAGLVILASGIWRMFLTPSTGWSYLGPNEPQAFALAILTGAMVATAGLCGRWVHPQWVEVEPIDPPVRG